LELLDDTTLGKLCQTNKYVKQLCQDNDFWRNRLVKTYPEVTNPQQYLQQRNLTWEQYYKFLKQRIKLGETAGLTAMKALANGGDFDIIQVITGRKPSVKNLLIRTRLSNKTRSPTIALNDLKQLAIHGIFPDQALLNQMLLDGTVDMLKFYASYNLYPTTDVAAQLQRYLADAHFQLDNRRFDNIAWYNQIR
jgi:hypothetical protein